MAVREIRQRLHVVAEAVLVRDPRDRDQPRPLVHERLEVRSRHGPVSRLDDAQLDAGRLFEMAIQHEGRVVVQFVDDDVVPAREREGTRDDVLAFARGEQEADFLR